MTTKKIAVLLLGGLSTCSTFTGHSGQPVTYTAGTVCGGVELAAINHEGAAAQAVLTVWPEGHEVYVDQTPVNDGQHDIRPFRFPDAVNDWQLLVERPNGEVLFTSRIQRSIPCATS